MSLSIHPVVGTIRLEPAPLEPAGRHGCDDSSLQRLLASFANLAVLSDPPRQPGKPFRLVAARRLTWRTNCVAEVAVRANLAQLIDDLEAEFEELGGVAS
jgi:hypothetical protein